MYQKAGIPQEKIVPIHGEDVTVSCLTCSKNYSREDVHERILGGEKVPLCSCGGDLIMKFD